MDKALNQVSIEGDVLPAPRHVAIIMDGNGRWAVKRNLPRALGHKNGAEAVEKTIRAALDLGIEYLTLYAFSSENWLRPAQEVSDLLGLLRLYLKKEIKRLHREDIKLQIIGSRSSLADDINKMIDEAEALTLNNKRLTLVIALSYGGRGEIVEAARNMALSIIEGKENLEDITQERFASYLSTHNIPDPDLILRTSGEQRVSNFLLWQMAYSEFVFMDVLWPDFSETDFREAIEIYCGRKRRFGARL